MNTVERQTLARNVRRLGHLDLPGAGQVTVRGSHDYVGHIPNPVHLGTSIIDIGDPRQPRVVATVTLDDHDSHSHKVRVAGDIMIVNHERNMSKIGRRAEQLPAARRALTEALKREPTRNEIAAQMSVTENDLAMLEAFEQRGYDNGGFKIVDVSEPARPKAAGAYNYHPLFPEPTHTVMPVPGRIGGRRIAVAIDEEDQALSASEEEARRGRAHACLLTFDVSDLGAIKPLGQFQVSELDSPFSRTSGARFGAHQFCERMAGTVVYAVWFGGGLRIIDVADPLSPREIGHFIPPPAADRSAPQSNDVALDERGLIYMVDRHVGFDILEHEGSR